MANPTVNRRFVELGWPFVNVDHWVRIETSKNDARFGLKHLAHAVNLPVDRVLQAYRPILADLGESLQSNSAMPDGYVHVSHLRALLYALPLGWSREDLDQAVAYFDRKNWKNQNKGLKATRWSYTYKAPGTSASEDVPVPKKRPLELVVDVEVAPPDQGPQAEPLSVKIIPYAQGAAALQQQQQPNDWQTAYCEEMRRYMGPEAVFAYRTTSQYKRACDAQLRAEVMKDEDGIRAEINQELEAELYADIKARVAQEMQALYEANPQWELRLEQQEARRAMENPGGPPRKDVYWTNNKE